jgi:hypothetical protein
MESPTCGLGREGRSRPGFPGQVLDVFKKEKSTGVRIKIVKEFMKNKKFTGHERASSQCGHFVSILTAFLSNFTQISFQTQYKLSNIDNNRFSSH